ncbi:DUF4179 domain-containing protein [Gottfriedia luciferensis]|uniref:DUF4179 domain-containing protein n=1 Tax=Gottfriedia luciferensis TaxID=178774 RepID=UPI000B44BE21|nr:DUF4179 domain-containing protein [Gottfriedia luciferensis]
MVVFEKEENELKNWKEQYENVDIPLSEIDNAIQNGFQKAKMTKIKAKQKRNTWIWSSIVAAILFIGFLTSIRVSPTFASYITNVPGMEKIVKLIQNDKGLVSAFENKYAQEIGISQEKNGVKVTINSVIADEQGIVIFYTIDSKKLQHNLQLVNMNLQPKNGDEFPEHSADYELPVKEELKSYTNSIEYYFNEPYEQHDFKLNLKIKSKEASEQFSIPFSIKNKRKRNKYMN